MQYIILSLRFTVYGKSQIIWFGLQSNHYNVRYVVEPNIRKSERKKQYSTDCYLHIDTEPCSYFKSSKNFSSICRSIMNHNTIYIKLHELMISNLRRKRTVQYCEQSK